MLECRPRGVLTDCRTVAVRPGCQPSVPDAAGSAQSTAASASQSWRPAAAAGWACWPLRTGGSRGVLARVSPWPCVSPEGQEVPADILAVPAAVRCTWWRQAHCRVLMGVQSCRRRPHWGRRARAQSSGRGCSPPTARVPARGALPGEGAERCVRGFALLPSFVAFVLQPRFAFIWFPNRPSRWLIFHPSTGCGQETHLSFRGSLGDSPVPWFWVGTGLGKPGG